MHININKNIIISGLIIFIIIGLFIGYSYINSDLSSAVSLNVTSKSCDDYNLYDLLTCMATPDNVKSKYVSSNAGVDFSRISSDTNGKGIYMLSSTIGNQYPISYFRGDVDNNYLSFAGFCWKIVRTTSTGGVKAIYNGSFSCNDTGEDTIIGKTAFNSSNNSLAYFGYMYGNIYTVSSMDIDNTFKYGSSFSFVDVNSNVSGDGTYTLTNQVSAIDNTHHYTCLNSTGTCSAIAYVYYKNSTKIFYTLLRDGKNIETAKNEIFTNTNNSTIKQSIDNWVSNVFNKQKTYTNYLEDAIWCNDRSENTDTKYTGKFNSGWNSNGGALDTLYWTQGYIRREFAYSPIFDTCPNKNDAFTVNDTTNGNGALTYPIGLLTSDEVLIAGGLNVEQENNYYLNNGIQYWLLNPIYFYDSGTSQSRVIDDGRLSSNNSNLVYGVRPVISIDYNYADFWFGDGTKDSPYYIEFGSHSG